MNTATRTRYAADTEGMVDADLTPKMVELLQAGAAHEYGRPFALRSEANACGPDLMELERLGYMRCHGYDWWITEQGRAAIGAPTEAQATNLRLRELKLKCAVLGTARRLQEKAEPRSADDFRGWHAARKVCVLVVKHRSGRASFQCSRDGSGPCFNLPFSQSASQPETSADFLLVIIPKWLADATHLDLLGVAPDLVGDWTGAQREAWDDLRSLRSGINYKIETANRVFRKQPTKLGYGFSA